MLRAVLLALLLLAVPASTFAGEEVASRAVLGLLAPRRGEWIADVGCGKGIYAFQLARAVGAGGKVLAVDIDPAAVASVRERAAAENVSNIEVIHSVADDPRLPVGKLDAIFMNNVIDWVERRSLAGFLAGVRKALKSDGRLVIRDPSGGPDRVIAELYRAGFALVEAKIPLETASDRSFSTGWYALKMRPAEIQPALLPRLGLPERHRTRLHLAEELFRMGLLDREELRRTWERVRSQPSAAEDGTGEARDVLKAAQALGVVTEEEARTLLERIGRQGR